MSEEIKNIGLAQYLVCKAERYTQFVVSYALLVIVTIAIHPPFCNKRMWYGIAWPLNLRTNNRICQIQSDR